MKYLIFFKVLCSFFNHFIGLLYIVCIQKIFFKNGSLLIIMNQRGQVCKACICKLKQALGLSLEKYKNVILLTMTRKGFMSIVFHHCGQSVQLTGKQATGRESSQSPALINPTVTLLLDSFLCSLLYVVLVTRCCWLCRLKCESEEARGGPRS